MFMLFVLSFETISTVYKSPKGLEKSTSSRIIFKKVQPLHARARGSLSMRKFKTWYLFSIFHTVLCLDGKGKPGFYLF